MAEVSGDVASGALGVAAEKVGAGAAELFLGGEGCTHNRHLTKNLVTLRLKVNSRKETVIY